MDYFVFVWTILHRTSTKNLVRIRADPKELELVHCSGYLYATQPYVQKYDLTRKQDLRWRHQNSSVFDARDSLEVFDSKLLQ